MQKTGVEKKWCLDAKKRLRNGRLYLKIDYKPHCNEEESSCGDHCRKYPLSDPRDKHFREKYDHQHLVVCEQCGESLNVTFYDIEKMIDQQQTKFETKEQKEDIVWDLRKSRGKILLWKAHILRSVNQGT